MQNFSIFRLKYTSQQVPRLRLIGMKVSDSLKTACRLRHVLYEARNLLVSCGLFRYSLLWHLNRGLVGIDGLASLYSSFLSNIGCFGSSSLTPLIRIDRPTKPGNLSRERKRQCCGARSCELPPSPQLPEQHSTLPSFRPPHQSSLIHSRGR